MLVTNVVLGRSVKKVGAGNPSDFNYDQQLMEHFQRYFRNYSGSYDVIRVVNLLELVEEKRDEVSVLRIYTEMILRFVFFMAQVIINMHLLLSSILQENNLFRTKDSHHLKRPIAVYYCSFRNLEKGCVTPYAPIIMPLVTGAGSVDCVPNLLSSLMEKIS